MSILLSKLLPVFVYPLGAAIALGLAALILSFTRLRRVLRVVLAVAFLGLWLASTPAASYWLVARLEAEYPRVPTDQAPHADAIVLLGGFVAESGGEVDIQDAGDRALEAMRLYRTGKAARIVISAGNVPWSAAQRPEADLIADLLVELGASRTDLVLEGKSRNTRENALYTAAIFAANGWSSGLLVTSAAHMPRAIAAFRKAGLALTPVPTDRRARFPLIESPLDLLPDAEALARTTTALKEMIGSVAYRLRGWE